jgi:peptidoglycan hydrolase CwlO-like protein
MNETSMQDLKELNKQIDSTEADINNLKNSMYEIIRQFGSDCINI